jgi:hypothetical protein
MFATRRCVQGLGGFGHRISLVLRLQCIHESQVSAQRSRSWLETYSATIARQQLAKFDVSRMVDVTDEQEAVMASCHEWIGFSWLTDLNFVDKVH